MTGPLLAIVVLVAGAVLVLLLVKLITDHSGVALLFGLPAVAAAAASGSQAPPPLGLAVVAVCGMCGVALLLLPVLEPELKAHRAEAAALLLLGTAGAVALASATDLVWAVVGLETLALCAVTLVALGAGERTLEAAFKYFVLGAISLAGLVYGLGLVYLGTGSFAFPTAGQTTGNPLTLAGVVLIGVGFAFELAVFPFHWGALDAYTAAAPSLAGFVMSASKLAAVYALGRLILEAGSGAFEVGQILVWLGSLTIVWGTFGALAQGSNLRRLLAYSAVTHAGFISLALGSGANGPATAAFYAAIYASMAMLVFASLASSNQAVIDVRGLGRLRALGLALGLFSLSGIPPTPGFWAKLAVLVVAWQSAGLVPTLIAVAGGVFSVLYYLRGLPDLLGAIRGDDGATRVPALVPGIGIAAIAVVLLGLFPGAIWALAQI